MSESRVSVFLKTSGFSWIFLQLPVCTLNNMCLLLAARAGAQRLLLRMLSTIVVTKVTLPYHQRGIGGPLPIDDHTVTSPISPRTAP